jgi:hypothetical protein
MDAVRGANCNSVATPKFYGFPRPALTLFTKMLGDARHTDFGRDVSGREKWDGGPKLMRSALTAPASQVEEGW